jgi:hypothetical protein
VRGTVSRRGRGGAGGLHAGRPGRRHRPGLARRAPLGHPLLRDLVGGAPEPRRDLLTYAPVAPRPPSSDPVGLKRKPPAPLSGRKRGGPPGYPKAQRAPVPPEQGRSTTDGKPTACRRGHHPLTGDDPEPLIHQVAELPVFEPLVDQYRLHRLVCPDCGATTCGVVPPGVPTGSFGPRLQGDQNKPKAALRDRHADLE